MNNSFDILKHLNISKEYIEAGQRNPYTGPVVMLQPEDYDKLINEVESLRKEKDEIQKKLDSVIQFVRESGPAR